MIRTVKLKKIRPNPYQCRKSEDPAAIKSLAEEIKIVGFWSGALRGRENGDHIELCYGHRRLAALRLLNWKDVEIDIAALSDEEMALQALVENMQREGLNDADKGEAITRYMEMYKSNNSTQRELSDHEVTTHVCHLLGLSKTRIYALIDVAKLSEPEKQLIRDRQIAGVTARAARDVGGDEGIRVAAEKQLSYGTMEAIRAKIRGLNERTKEKVKRSFQDGEIITPEDVDAKVRRLDAAAFRRDATNVPPDLITVMQGWTERATRWTEQLQEVATYIDYIDSNPRVAERWRMAARLLIAQLNRFC